MRTPNKYKVPLRQWRRWSRHARMVFNTVYGEHVNAQDILAPPSAAKLSKTTWRVLSWNFAWIAASAVDAAVI